MAAASIAATAILAFAISDRLPHWRMRGGGFVTAPQPLLAMGLPITLTSPVRILCLGDSLTYGLDRWFGTRDPINGSGSRRVAAPYPEALGQALGRNAAVVNLGFPGDRLSDGMRRWRRAQDAALVIIMYGTNDADPRGWAAPAVPIDRYRRTLAALARRWRSDGAAVLIMAPPPAGTTAGEKAVAPYRRAARAAALDASAAFVDPAMFMTDIDTPFQSDGLHLRGEATHAIGAGLSRSIVLLSSSKKGTIVP